MLKIHVHKSVAEEFGNEEELTIGVLLSILYQARRQGMQLVDSLEESNVVILAGLPMFKELHSLERHFIVIGQPVQKLESGLPLINVFELPFPVQVNELVEALYTIENVRRYMKLAEDIEP